MTSQKAKCRFCDASASPSPGVDRRCVGGGGHRGPRSAEAAQEVQEDQTEAEGNQEAVGASAERATPGHHHHSGGVCGGGDHVVAVVGLHL